MKFLRLLVLFFAAGLVFTSCQKELSFEAGDATGTLKADATGDCLPVIINGTYQKDTLLKSTNSVDVSVDIITTGAYFIKTDTLNGYSFSASGNAQTTGATTIHLVGSGRPLNPGVDVFTVKFGESICQINVVVTGPGGGGGTTAVYSLGGSPGTCTGAVLAGTYTQGTAMTSANTATINVTVTTLGTYSITTPVVNGVSFTKSGTFASLGATTVVLVAGGTPTAANTSSYAVNSGTSNCSFDVTYAAAGPPGTYTVNCTGAVVAGTYQVGTAMTASNQMTVGVTTLTAGSYNITTGAVNGVTFTGSGTLAAGTNNVILTATGTPLAAGPFNYPLNGSPVTTACNVSVTFTAAASPAAFTIICPSTPTFTGTYQPGVAATGGTMVVPVMVTTAGAYNVTTTAVNGVTFAGTGTLASGAQTITLTATGTATAAGGFVYNVPGSTGSCAVTVFYDGLIVTLGGNTKTFNFTVDPSTPAATYDNSSVPGYTFLNLDTYNDASSFEEFQILLGNATGVFTAGTTYTVNQGTAVLLGADYTIASGADDYSVQSNPPTVQPTPFSVTITSINATRVTGTFTGGPLVSTGGAGNLTVSNGSFSLKF